MSEEKHDIEINVKTTGVDASAASLDKLSKSSAGTKFAMWGFGEQAQNAAEKLGLPGKMARKVGDTVEAMGASLGKAALAFGIIGVAATAGYTIYRHFAEANKKAHEELQKSTGQMYEHTRALYNNKLETLAVKTAKEDLAKAEREIYLSKSVQLIKDERLELEKLKRQQEEGLGFWKKMWQTMSNPTLDAAKEQKGLADAQKKYRDELQLTINAKEKEIRVAEQERKAAMGDMSNSAYLQEVIKYKDIENQREIKASQAKIAQQQATDQAILASARARATDLETVNLIEQEQFDRATQSKLETMKDYEQREDYRVQRSIERETLLYNQQMQLEEKKRQMAAQTAGNFAQVGQLMASQGGQNARKWFTLQKTAATAEALINTYQAATKAYAQGGVYGAVLAASVVALGLAQVAKIRSMQFDGGGSGGGSVGTYSANPATGLPQDNYKYFNYEQSTYGSGWRPGEGQSGNVTYVYAIDRKSFEDVMMENAGTVKKANDHANKGYA